MAFIRFLVTLLVLANGLAYAQTVGPPTRPVVGAPVAESASLGSIRGRIVLSGGTFVAETVKITVQASRGNQTIVYTDNQGQFEVRSLPAGNYTLEVEADRQRFDVSTEQIQVYRGMPSIVTVTLKERLASNRIGPSGSVVSVGELDKDIPVKARKEFDRASKATQEGKALEAIDHLRKAIAIYPNFMMAHNDLGAQLLEQGRLDEATKELRLAINLDAKASNPYLNLGIILVRQQKFSEAAEVLRTALSLESNSPTARLYAGLASLGLNDLEGAERELKAAYDLGGAPYAMALFHLGQVYMNKGERDRALKAFEAYLHDMPEAGNVAQVRKLINMLR